MTPMSQDLAKLISLLVIYEILKLKERNVRVMKD